MYDIALSPKDENFLEEGFRHFHHELRFFALTGQVLDTQKRANTHLSASHSHSASNGGYIYGGYGSMGGNAHSSMRISSYVTTEHEFWIRLGDGSEACFGFADSSIQMRTGQWLTMVFVRPVESTDGLLCAIYNHASKSYQGVMPPTAINSRFGLYTEQPGFPMHRSFRLVKRSRLLLAAPKLTNSRVVSLRRSLKAGRQPVAFASEWGQMWSRLGSEYMSSRGGCLLTNKY